MTPWIDVKYEVRQRGIEKLPVMTTLFTVESVEEAAAKLEEARQFHWENGRWLITLDLATRYGPLRDQQSNVSEQVMAAWKRLREAGAELPVDAPVAVQGETLTNGVNR
jgi:hypothetical protein